MAVSVYRFGSGRRPSRGLDHAYARVPSIASLSFSAVIGLVLLLQSLAIAPDGSSAPSAASAAGSGSDAAAGPTQDYQRVQPVQNVSGDVLGEQSAGLSTSDGSSLRAASDMESGGPAGLDVIEPLPEASIQAAQAQVVSVASSHVPEAVAPAGVPGCQDHGALYCVYEVQPGETLASIAGLAGLLSTEDVAAHDLLVHSNRAALNSSADVLEAGEMLRIPLQQGILHTVISQETLSGIASRYDVEAEDIAAVPGNSITDGNVLSAGSEILVPNPTRLGLAVAIPGGVAAGGSGVLSWPAVGAITSEFGPSHPLGVDIALMPGDPVMAAAGGTVSFSGGDACCSYGLFVIIDHGNGMHTLYGHLSVLYVDAGEVVAAGERIGLGGYTGFGTGPHLHFEVHVGEGLADPLAYLP